MAKYALPCIACGVPLANIDDTATNQPYNGTAFTTHGHYGSTAFDPMDGYFLEINICDACLILRSDRIMQGRDRKPVMKDGTIVGFTDTYEALVPWSPSRTDIKHVLDTTVKERDLIPIHELTDEEIDNA